MSLKLFSQPRAAFTFLLALLLPQALCADYPDLCDLQSDFIIETQKIEIPGYPFAFNPSMVRWKGQILMCVRAGKEGSPHYPGQPGAQEEEACEPPPLEAFSLMNQHYFQRDLRCDSPNRFCLLWLDEDFQPIGTPQLLEIPHHRGIYRQQDPRLVIVGERLFIVYGNFTEGALPPNLAGTSAFFIDNAPKRELIATRRLFYAEITLQKGRFVMHEPECLANFEGEDPRRWQKNWVPFDYKNELLLSYSIEPHRVMQLHRGTESCSTLCTSSAEIHWDWGVLRGGTPALRDGEEYLAFFHSSKEMKTAQSRGDKISHYVMGAYTFSKQPPFEVTRISPQPIIDKSFFLGPPYKTWKPLWVVFPGGFLFDQDFIWLAYGRQDHEVCIAKLDKKRLYASLIPVYPK